MKQITKENKMIQSKGEALITLVVGETLIDPNELMNNEDFVKEAKRLIKAKFDFYTVKDKLVKWCNENY
jgi:hypothetical protein